MLLLLLSLVGLANHKGVSVDDNIFGRLSCGARRHRGRLVSVQQGSRRLLAVILLLLVVFVAASCGSRRRLSRSVQDVAVALQCSPIVVASVQVAAIEAKGAVQIATLVCVHNRRRLFSVCRRRQAQLAGTFGKALAPGQIGASLVLPGAVARPVKVARVVWTQVSSLAGAKRRARGTSRRDRSRGCRGRVRVRVGAAAQMGLVGARAEMHVVVQLTGAHLAAATAEPVGAIGAAVSVAVAAVPTAAVAAATIATVATVATVAAIAATAPAAATAVAGAVAAAAAAVAAASLVVAAIAARRVVAAAAAAWVVFLLEACCTTITRDR